MSWYQMLYSSHLWIPGVGSNRGRL